MTTPATSARILLLLLALAVSAHTAQSGILDAAQSAVDSVSQSVEGIVGAHAPGGGKGTSSGSGQKEGDSHGGAGLTFGPVLGWQRPSSCVVLLHGMDTSAKLLAPIVLFAQGSGLARTRFILPQAPTAYVDYKKQSVISWFNMGSSDMLDPAGEFADEILAAVKRIDGIVQGEYKAGIPPGKVAVIGMSQGGAVATTLYMRSSATLGGAIGVSTWLPLLSSYPKSASDANSKLDILMIHGSADTAVPLSAAQAGVAKMKSVGRSVSLNVIDGAGHLLGNDLIPVADSIIGYLKARGFE